MRFTIQFNNSHWTTYSICKPIEMYVYVGSILFRCCCCCCYQFSIVVFVFVFFLRWRCPPLPHLIFFFAFSLSVGCSLQGDNRRIVRKSMYGIEVRSNRLIDHVYSSVQANKHIASHTHTHNRPQLYHYNRCLCRRFFCFFFSFVDL